MAIKLTRLTHKTAIKLHLVTAVPFAVLAPGGQSGKFWIHHRPRGVGSVRHRPCSSRFEDQTGPERTFSHASPLLHPYHSHAVVYVGNIRHQPWLGTNFKSADHHRHHHNHNNHLHFIQGKCKSWSGGNIYQNMGSYLHHIQAGRSKDGKRSHLEAKAINSFILVTLYYWHTEIKELQWAGYVARIGHTKCLQNFGGGKQY
jgi:hypothetical protein